MPAHNPIPGALSLEELMEEFNSEVERLENDRRELEEEFSSGRAYLRMKLN